MPDNEYYPFHPPRNGNRGNSSCGGGGGGCGGSWGGEGEWFTFSILINYMIKYEISWHKVL